jgi:Spy/CpxP family protein refolding chaperone
MKILKFLLTIGLLTGLLIVTAEARGGHGKSGKGNKGHHASKHDRNVTEAQSTSRICRHYKRNALKTAMKEVNVTDDQQESIRDLVEIYHYEKHEVINDLNLTRSERRTLRETCKADTEGENTTCVILTTLKSELETTILGLLTDDQVTQYATALATLEESCSEEIETNTTE